MKLLTLVDTPTENTGFACVIRNLLPHWRSHFERIDIWGINYHGWPHEYPYRIFPAGNHWASLDKLNRLLLHIRGADYTHLWILQDSFLLSDNNFPKVLKALCNEKKIHIMTYYPVDAPMEDEWLDIVRVSEVAVTYTPYGVQETIKANKQIDSLPKIQIIPHGVDTDIFRPLIPEERELLRGKYFPNWDNAIILINVNRNERRKSLIHSLQVLNELIAKSGPMFKLYLHCLGINEPEQIDLFQIGNSLGLKYGEDWMVPEQSNFARGIGGFASDELNELYNASDICITTSTGEGWGLSITEAASAGLQVVGPDHTSLPYIRDICNAGNKPGKIRLVPRINSGIVFPKDNSRIRYAVNIPSMVAEISDCSSLRHFRSPLSSTAMETLSWKRIAQDWLKLFWSTNQNKFGD